MSPGPNVSGFVCHGTRRTVDQDWGLSLLQWVTRGRRGLAEHSLLHPEHRVEQDAAPGVRRRGVHQPPALTLLVVQVGGDAVGVLALVGVDGFPGVRLRPSAVE